MQSSKDVASGIGEIGSADAFPTIIPRKPRHGRRSEAMAEINCLEWENFAFHPSPLIILVFKRYNSLWCLKLLFHIASDNWKLLKELEEAIKVYWNAKDRLPPRAVKIDINIKRDLAYALKVKGCPQILFLRGHGVVYRKKEVRNADELVQKMAFFYYNAKKACLD
ncbi:hypothetical protein HN51_038524 [Arachis hypogaea]